MKIGVIADTVLREEIETKRRSPDTEYIFIEHIEDAGSPGGIDAYFDLAFEMTAGRVSRLSQLLPVPVFVNDVLHTLDEIGAAFVRINAWPTFLRREICELSVPDAKAADRAQAVMQALDWPYRIVPDVPGMISARIISMIINEAYYTLQENISTREDIDTAMKLGTNYPFGPFEWSRLIGLQKIYDLLSALNRLDARYTVSELLRREAIATFS